MQNTAALITGDWDSDTRVLGWMHMNLFHKAYAFRISFSTSPFAINTARNGCADAASDAAFCPRVMALEMSVI